MMFFAAVLGWLVWGGLAYAAVLFWRNPMTWQNAGLLALAGLVWLAVDAVRLLARKRA